MLSVVSSVLSAVTLCVMLYQLSVVLSILCQLPVTLRGVCVGTSVGVNYFQPLSSLKNKHLFILVMTLGDIFLSCQWSFL